MSAREAGSETFDVVYTWVNGSDPSFLESLSSYVNAHDRHDASPQRFDDKYELKFSLRLLPILTYIQNGNYRGIGERTLIL